MAFAAHDLHRELALTAPGVPLRAEPAFLTRARSAGWPTESDPPDARELDGRAERVDAEHQAEDIDLDALLHTDKYAGEPEQGDLEPPTARGAGNDPAAVEVVLADGDGGKLDAELGHSARHEGDKRVAVGARPQAIVEGVGICIHRLRNLRDHPCRGRASQLLHESRRLAVPRTVRKIG